MAVEILISRKTTINSHSASGYTISLHQTDKLVTGKLASDGPVINDTVRASGVFLSERAAVEAVLGYVTAAVAVVADTDWISGDTTVRLVRRNAPPPHGCSRRILGTTSRNGIYVKTA